MERDNADKTSAVHFLRFDLAPDMAQALLQRAATLGIGVDHPKYKASIDPVANEVRASLAADIQI
jgi:glycerol-3-phosphate dehydrogenase subunit C